MKKIMFNDRFGLTESVITGTKTQTRRMITYPKRFKGKDVCGYYVCKRVTDGVITELCMYDEDERTIDEGQILPKYMVGEVVAVAQKYKDSCLINPSFHNNPYFLKGLPGWSNKMFVRGDMMPYRIKITGVGVERLQDITEEDCLKEGIIKGKCGSENTHFMDAYYIPNDIQPYCTAREAYSVLIDKISGNGTWERNPYVWVYDFELSKQPITGF